MKNIVTILLICFSFTLFGQIGTISNGESGLSTRTKLNRVIDTVNNYIDWTNYIENTDPDNYDMFLLQNNSTGYKNYITFAGLKDSINNWILSGDTLWTNQDILIINDFFEIYGNDSIKINFANDTATWYMDGDTVRMLTDSAFVINNLVTLGGGGASYWVFNPVNSAIYYTAGNVGIGTDSPLKALHVMGSAQFRDTIFYSNSPVMFANGNRFLHLYGTNNMSIGENAGNFSLTSSNNIFIGNSTGISNTSGGNNAFIGYEAGNKSTSGGGNIYIGYLSGHESLTGSGNIDIGYRAGYSNTANQNAFIGYEAGYSNTSGANQSFIGYKAGRTTTTGGSNTFVGKEAGYSNATGSNNTFIGVKAGYNITGSSNVCIGYSAGENETGSNKLYIANTNTVNPLIYGDFSTSALTFNCAANLAALSTQPTGAVDLAIATTKYVNDKVPNGTNTYLAIFDGSGLTEDADLNYVNDILTTDSLNVKSNLIRFNSTNFIKSDAGVSSVFIGDEAGKVDDGYNYSVNIGYQAGLKTTSGTGNVFIGYQAGENNVTGYENVFIGGNAGYNTTGAKNTFIGIDAGKGNTTGDNNISIGYAAGIQSTGSYKLFIDSRGYTSQSNEADSTFLQGDMDSRILSTGKGVGLEIGKNGITTYTTKVTLISDSILVSNTRPQELIPAPGSGKVISITKCIFYLNFNTTPYATNTTGRIDYNTGTATIGTFGISGTGDVIYTLETEGNKQCKENESFVYYTATGDPTAGDSPITFYITYQIIEL